VAVGVAVTLGVAVGVRVGPAWALIWTTVLQLSSRGMGTRLATQAMLVPVTSIPSTAVGARVAVKVTVAFPFPSLTPVHSNTLALASAPVGGVTLRAIGIQLELLWNTNPDPRKSSTVTELFGAAPVTVI